MPAAASIAATTFVLSVTSCAVWATTGGVASVSMTASLVIDWAVLFSESVSSVNETTSPVGLMYSLPWGVGATDWVALGMPGVASAAGAAGLAAPEGPGVEAAGALAGV
ncbi:hypothetical protein D4765_13990 [Subtercola vilae]|uniref:Secreted protein n=1 Tax=Subtercola vilae TaxID=2056433 RepID=A0A4T2BRE7_9MICO|nr:hypothetical protein D4765_13990 [Subtercola vilae]